MGDLYREQALTALFQALDVDHHGSIAGDKLIDSIQLLDLDEESEQLRTAAADISAVLREDMTCDQFLEDFNARLPNEPDTFLSLCQGYMQVASLLVRSTALRSLFAALDIDGNGVIEGQELIDRMELLDLGELRTAGAQISALLTDGMEQAQFVSAFDRRLPRDAVQFAAMCSDYTEVAARLRNPKERQEHSSEQEEEDLSDWFDPPLPTKSAATSFDPTQYAHATPKQHLASIVLQTAWRGWLARRRFQAKRGTLELKAPPEGLTQDERFRRYGWLVEIFGAISQAAGEDGIQKGILITVLRAMLDASSQEPYTPAMEDRLWESLLAEAKGGPISQSDFCLVFGRLLPAGALEFKVAIESILATANELWQERVACELREADRASQRERWVAEDAVVQEHRTTMRQKVWLQQELVRAAEVKRRTEVVASVEAELGGTEHATSPQQVRHQSIRALFSAVGGDTDGFVTATVMDQLGLLAAMRRHGGHGYGDTWHERDRLTEAEFISLLDGILPDSVEATDAMVAQLIRQASIRPEAALSPASPVEGKPVALCPATTDIASVSPTTASILDDVLSQMEQHEKVEEDIPNPDPAPQPPHEIELPPEAGPYSLDGPLWRLPCSSNPVEPRGGIEEALQREREDAMGRLEALLPASSAPAPQGVSAAMGDVLRRLEEGIDSVHTDHPILEGGIHPNAFDGVAESEDDVELDAESHLTQHRKLVETLAQCNQSRVKGSDAEHELSLLWALIELAQSDLKDLQGLITVGAHQVVWGALLRHSTKPDVQLVAAEVLCTLAFGSIMSRRAMANDGLREEIGCYLFSDSVDARVGHRLGDVMMEICLGGGGESFAHEAEIGMVLARMEQRPGDLRLSRDGCRAIARCHAWLSREGLVSSLGESLVVGSMQRIAATMARHQGDARLHEEAALAVSCIISEPAAEAAWLAAGGIDLLLSSLSRHQADTRTVGALGEAIARAESQEACTAAVRAGGTAIILEAMAAVPLDAPAQGSLAEAMSVLLCGSETAVAAACEAQGVAILSRSMVAQWAKPGGGPRKVQWHATCLVELLSHEGGDLIALKAGVAAMGVALVYHEIEIEINAEICRWEGQPQLVRSLPQRKRIQRGAHKGSLLAACRLLANLAHSSQGAEGCVRAGAVEAMLHLDRVAGVGDPARQSLVDRAKWVLASWEALVNLTAAEGGAKEAASAGAFEVAARGLRVALDRVDIGLAGLHAMVLRNLTAHCELAEVVKDLPVVDAIVGGLKASAAKLSLALTEEEPEEEPEEGGDPKKEEEGRLALALLTTTKNIAYVSSSVKLLLDYGAHGAVIALIGERGSPMRGVGMQALRNISADPDGSLKISESRGGMACILGAIKDVEESHEVIQYACAALRNMAASHKNVQDEMVLRGAPVLLVELLARSTSFEVEWHCLLAVAHLANAEGAQHNQEMLEREAAKLVVEVMKRYYDCYELQLVGLHAISGFSSGGSEAIKHLVDAGGHHAVVTIVGANRDKPAILTSACEVLARFAQHASGSLVQGGLHVVVSQALRSRKDNHRLQAAALTTLCHLIGGGTELDALEYAKKQTTRRGGKVETEADVALRETRVAIGKEAICVGAIGFAMEVMLGLLDEESDHQELLAIAARIKLACGAAAALCYTSKEARISVVQTGLHNEALAAMTRFERSLKLQLHVVAMITVLALDTEAHFESPAALPATLSAVCLHAAEKSQMAEMGCRCLSVLCRESKQDAVSYEVLRGVMHSVIGPHHKDLSLLAEAAAVLEALAGSSDEVAIPASRALVQLLREHPRASHLLPAVCRALTALARTSPGVLAELRAQRCDTEILEAVQNFPTVSRVVESSLMLLVVLVADSSPHGDAQAKQYRGGLSGAENIVGAAAEMHKGEGASEVRRAANEVLTWLRVGDVLSVSLNEGLSVSQNQMSQQHSSHQPPQHQQQPSQQLRSTCDSSRPKSA